MNYTQDDDLTNKFFRKNDIITVDFTGNYKKIILYPGKYKIECWGAEGSKNQNAGPAGKGGYTKGIITLQEQTILYVYVGQNVNAANVSSFNGAITSSGGGGPGGGASDIRLKTSANWYDIDSLRSRIMVAAGGGSSTATGGFTAYSRHGGGLIGEAAGPNVLGGTQTAGGYDSVAGFHGTFGYGSNLGATGGGGYYGGAGNGWAFGGGAGGSSFISGHIGCDAIDPNGNHTNQPIHYSGLYFTDTIMMSGINVDNGRIRITVIENSLYLINHSGEPKYIKNGELYGVGSTINTLQLSIFEQFGMNGLEFQTPFFDSNKLSLLVCSLDNQLHHLFIAGDQIIITKNYFEIGNYSTIYKMKIDEILNGGFIKYIFCIQDKWYWFNDGFWEETTLDDFNVNIGNTSIEINNFTELVWRNFDDIFISTEKVFNREIKLAALLSHSEYSQKPIISKIEMWCYLPIEGISISSDKYTVINYFDKYEVTWNDNIKTILQIIYE